MLPTDFFIPVFRVSSTVAVQTLEVGAKLLTVIVDFVNVYYGAKHKNMTM
jgi:hypothetical protein